jgi:hypothetical protein
VSWKFGEEAPVETRGDISTITIDYGGTDFNVEWKYDIATNTYARSIGGTPEAERTGEQVKVKNVIVVYVDFVYRSSDDKNRKDMVVIGEREALVFSNGSLTQGKWNKPSTAERTRFVNAAGEDIPLTPGQTWINIVPPLQNRVNYEQTAAI